MYARISTISAALANVNATRSLAMIFRRREVAKSCFPLDEENIVESWGYHFHCPARSCERSSDGRNVQYDIKPLRFLRNCPAAAAAAADSASEGQAPELDVSDNPADRRHSIFAEARGQVVPPLAGLFPSSLLSLSVSVSPRRRRDGRHITEWNNKSYRLFRGRERRGRLVARFGGGQRGAARARARARDRS